MATWWVEQSSCTEGGGRWLPGGWNKAAVLRERGEVATWWVEQSSCTEGGGRWLPGGWNKAAVLREGGGGYLVGGTKQLY